MESRSLHKIAVLGPESTGKSTLCEQLAIHFEEPWVPEYGRTYLEEHSADYQQSDLLVIAQGMQQLEIHKGAQASRWLFCDTELIMMKVWYQVKYEAVHPWVLQELDKTPYDFYLLCFPDLPWEADPLRENPHMREELFQRYETELKHYGFPFAIIKGEGSERLENAKFAIQQHFKNLSR